MRINRFRKGLLCLSGFLILLFSAGSLQAQEGGIPRDDAPVELRKPHQSKIDRFAADEEFQYGQNPQGEESFLEMIWNWLGRLFKKVFGTSFGTFFEQYGEIIFRVIFWALIAACIAGLVVIFLKSNLRTVFYGKGADKVNIFYRALDENIHAIDFDEEIREAIAKKDHRRAVRLYYLKVLKQLSDREMIAWKPDKTNRDYFRELRGSTFQRPFIDLSFLYERIWYGNFGIDESRFEEVSGRFRGFINKLGT